MWSNFQAERLKRHAAGMDNNMMVMSSPYIHLGHRGLLRNSVSDGGLVSTTLNMTSSLPTDHCTEQSVAGIKNLPFSLCLQKNTRQPGISQSGNHLSYFWITATTFPLQKPQTKWIPIYFSLVHMYILSNTIAHNV
jgi:hypothetical protein